MFCPECGSQLPENAAFCSECGAKVEPVVNQEPTQEVTPEIVKVPKSKKKIPKIAIIIPAIVLVLVVGLVSTYFVLKSQTDPKKHVKHFAEAYVGGDSDNLFDAIGFEESTFITKELFKNSITDSDSFPSFGEMSDFSIDKMADSADKDQLSYLVSFRDSSNAYTNSVILKFAKKNSKSYLIFDNWQMQKMDYLSLNYSVAVPSGAAVKMDGIELSSGDVKKSEEGLDYYVIPYMFSGQHKLTVNMENYEEYSAEITTNQYTYEDYQGEKVNPSDLKLKQEIMDQLSEKAKNMITNVYSAYVEEKSFADAISDNKFEKSDFQDECQKYYEKNIKDEIKGDRHLTSVKFNKMDVSSEQYVDWEDNCLGVYITVDSDYTSKSVYTPFFSNKKKKGSYDSSVSYRLTYHFVDGEWVINNTNLFSYFVYYQRY